MIVSNKAAHGLVFSCFPRCSASGVFLLITSVLSIVMLSLLKHVTIILFFSIIELPEDYREIYVKQLNPEFPLFHNHLFF